MKWTIHQLHQLQYKGLIIDEQVDVSDLKQIEKSIREISPVHVQGRADLSSTKFTFHLKITGEMVLPCSRTLVDVVYPFEIHTTETFLLNDYDYTTGEDSHVIQGEVVDLTTIIKELILLEIPMQIFADGENTEGAAAPQSGKDWEVVTEEQLKNKIDPRLAGLAKFFEKKNQD